MVFPVGRIMQRGRFRSGFDRPPGRQPLDKSKEGEREREREEARRVFVTRPRGNNLRGRWRKFTWMRSRS